MRKSADSQGVTVILQIGEEAEGYYVGSTDKDRGPNLSRVHNFVNRDGEPFQIWGSASLDRVFCGDVGKELEKERPKVPAGHYCWIKRTADLSENSKGVKFRQPMKNYTIDFDDEDIAPGFGNNSSVPAMAPMPQGNEHHANPSVPQSVVQQATPTADGDDEIPW